MSNGPESADTDAVDAALNAAADDAAKLKADLQSAEERVLRAQAEIENVRKRVQRDKEDALKYAAMPLVRDLLNVVDNLDRALSAAQQTADAGGLQEGVKMVAAQLQQVLKQHHCTPIATTGVEFDPNLHQAIAQEPSAEFAAGKVTRAAQVGYLLHDRVVRPAQVFVSTGAPTV